VLVGEESALLGRLVRAMESRGARTLRRDPADPRGALADAGHVAGVVDLTPLATTIEEAMDAAAVQAVAVDACRTTLGLAQAVAAAEVPPTLVVVTRGSQAVGSPGVTQPQQAAVWGLRTVAALEHPGARWRAVDLDPDAPPGEAEALADELLSADGEDEVTHRGGGRYVARLVPDHSTRHQRGPVPAVELHVRERGLLESLGLRSQERRAPGPGEVEIELRATGLNFRDVLNALGLYPGEPGPLGDEGAGVVRAVGPGVREFLVGDAVMGFAPGSFRSFVTVPSSLVVRKPPALSFEEAAAVPVAFLTADYAFDALAGLRRGQSVLIHAAAGGVGLAAVNLARDRGAIVFVTAGSEAKREYLRALGVPHVMDSRSLAFVEEVLAATEGQGVDVVLNSLAGEFIPASLGVTRRGGTFVEIGRTRIWSEEQVAALGRDIRYHVLFLGDLRTREPEPLRERLCALVDRLAAGQLGMPPVRVFPLESAPSAFRFMAQARHIGKIVVTHAHGEARAVDGTCLVTGGFGALGLQAARSLADAGARALVLLGRRAPGEAALAAARELEQRELIVRMAVADVADGVALENALAAALDGLPPLRIVVHAAGTLQDAMLLDQDERHLEVTFRPKVAGAWNLHRLTRHAPIDSFVLFSAGAALLGAPAQANYAAANAVLDAFASYRRAQGLPALSIDWGAWSGVGMAARLDDRHRLRMDERGLGTISPEEGGALLVSLLAEQGARVAVLPARWERYLQASAPRVPPLLRELAGAAEGTAAGRGETSRPPLVAQLREAAESRRRGLLLAHLQRLAVRVLGASPDATIDPARPLRELGLDSLMAVELRNWLARDTENPLPATLLFDHPTLDGLADYLMDAVLGRRGSGPVGAEPVAAEPAVAARAVASLTDDEAERALLAELESLGGGERG
jgi:NADPH:quinone reductase-like Zn-dependent oxidoreductase/NADP-dependent 3-hydroxy acid dehydrogenase YdfG